MWLKSAVFWLGFLLILPQALYVRRSAARADAAPGPRRGSIGDGEPTVYLFGVGDSIIDGVGTSSLNKAVLGQTAEALGEQLDTQVFWQGLGKSGHRTAQVMELLACEPPEARADFVLLSVGVNDVTGLRTLRQWRRDLRSLLLALHEQCAESSILMIGLPPMGEFPLLPQPLRALFGLRALQFEVAAMEEIERFKCTSYARIDLPANADSFAEDGYHPSEEACRELGRSLANSLLSGSQCTVALTQADPGDLH